MAHPLLLLLPFLLPLLRLCAMFFLLYRCHRASEMLNPLIDAGFGIWKNLDTPFLDHCRYGGVNEMFVSQSICVLTGKQRRTVTWCVIRSLPKAAQRRAFTALPQRTPVPVLRVVWHDTRTYLYLTGRWNCSAAVWFRKRMWGKLAVSVKSMICFFYLAG